MYLKVAKLDGRGISVAAYNSREFGFGGSVEIQSPPRITVALTDGSNFLTR